MAVELDPHEVARRVRAAMSYGDLSRDAAAAAMHVSPSTLDRIAGKRTSRPRGADWAELWRLADASGLPREWFSADLERLPEIVTDGPTFTRPEPARAEMTRRLQERAAEGRRSPSPADTEPSAALGPDRRREAP